MEIDSGKWLRTGAIYFIHAAKKKNCAGRKSNIGTTGTHSANSRSLFEMEGKRQRVGQARSREKMLERLELIE